MQHLGWQEGGHRLDRRPGIGEQLGRRLDRRLDLGLDGQAGARIEMQADLEALGLERPGAPVDGSRRQAGIVARIGLGELGHQQRGIAHRAGHRPDRPPEIRRIDGDAAEAGLQRENAVPRGRQADRAADVGAEMQRPVAGRCRGAGAGARASGIPGEVPRVARQRMEGAAARRQHAVVRHGGLGEDDGTRLTHPRRRRRIERGRHQLGRRRAQRHRHALGGDVLLDGDGHAIQHTLWHALLPALFGGLGGLADASEVRRVKRLDLRLPSLDVLDHGVDDFDGRQFLGLVGGQQVAGSHVMKSGHGDTLDVRQ